MNAVRRFLFVLTGVCALGLCAGPVRASGAEESGKESASAKPLMWVVETNGEDARMSLDRISGDSHSPYLTGDNAYDSENHYLASPFALSKRNESRE